MVRTVGGTRESSRWGRGHRTMRGLEMDALLYVVQSNRIRKHVKGGIQIIY